MGCLYIVGTPIGNLEDISKRALITLEKADFIIAEDCRVTLKLLNRYEINKSLISYHKFSDIKKVKNIVNRLVNGETAALVSDAGMPCVCDPGVNIVSCCYENNVKVSVVPGPCALISAICLSGLDCSRFTFYGFLSTTTKNRVKALEFLKELEHIVILYEAPHKLVKTLKDLLKYFKDREIVLVKEMTKIYENVEITTIANALNKYSLINSVKGEYVIIIKGKQVLKKPEVSLKEAVDFAKQLMQKGESASFSAKKAAKCLNYKKSEIYKALNLGEDII